jgi:hypothetical protein
VRLRTNHAAPTQAVPNTSATSRNPEWTHHKIDQRDAIADAIADEPTAPTPILAGELMELEGPALTLFRFATTGERRPVVIDIPRHLCSPAVRGKLYDLLIAVEGEEATRVAHVTAVPVLSLLPIA